MKKIRIATIILTGLMCAAALAGCGNDSADRQDQNDRTQSEQAGGESEFTDLTSFTARTLDGKKFTQEDFADADLTAINVWATSCGPCIDEMPALAEFEKSLPDNVKLITYCLDAEYEGAAQSLEQILDESGYEGITLTGGDGDLRTFAGEIQYTPTTVFVDSSGKMVGKSIIGAGEDPADVYTEYINAALTSLGKQEIE